MLAAVAMLLILSIFIWRLGLKVADKYAIHPDSRIKKHIVS